MGSKLVPTAIYTLYILWDDACSGPPVTWISTVNVYAVNLALANELRLTEKEHMIIHLNPLLRVSWNPSYYARLFTFFVDNRVALFDAISRRTVHRLSNYAGNHNLTVLVCLDLERTFDVHLRGRSYYAANRLLLGEYKSVDDIPLLRE
ncbi:MAG: hypothetical protein E3J35_06300 [Methanomassiliicoccales archaeon]|nr:MAG: hypothetical protein E3J35_06300 [Methanomassiliicoccales archaeon]